MNHVARRRLLLATLLTPISARAAARPYRIGVLATGSPALLRQTLLELGYAEGRDVVFEVRAIDGRTELLDAFAADLVRLRVDVIVAANPAAVRSAKRATATIPIVMMHTPDPVQLGLVASLAKPGGNITGVTTLSADLTLKQLELLREAIPRLSRVVLLWIPDNPWHPQTVKTLRAHGGTMGLQVRDRDVRRPEAFEDAFRAIAAERADGVVLLVDPLTLFHRRRLADLAIGQRLPMIGGLADYADAGCLMSYWADTADVYRRAASYVDRLLKGAKPGDLPIEQPTKYELVANRRTANTLGIALPQSILVRADRVID